MRADDDVARMGGDEFLILARVADATEAAGIAERCVRTASQPLVVDEDRCRVTISVGMALARSGARAIDADALLSAADGALYEAKRRGKNRWHLARGPE